MIVKTRGGFKVIGEGGRALSKPDLTLEQAKKRLQQIEFFKHKKKKG